MKAPITFTHLVTGHTIDVLDKDAIACVMHADCIAGGKTVPSATWLILENVPNPIPIVETKEEVFQKLGVKK